MNEASWPIFMAAPFISPRMEAIFTAVSRWRPSSRRSASSLSRATFAALVPAYRVACAPIAVPSFADRRILPWGILSSDIGYQYARRAPFSDGRITALYGPPFDHRWREPLLTRPYLPKSTLAPPIRRGPLPGPPAQPAFFYPGRPHGFRPRHAQRLRPHRVRLASHAPPAAFRARAGDRLRRRQGRPSLPGSRA